MNLAKVVWLSWVDVGVELSLSEFGIELRNMLSLIVASALHFGLECLSEDSFFSMAR